ncbi:MAG: lysophospholipid acyltransferase family protein [Schleiferiaceae bacterium]|nr:lysophospholipid acyltransferase family protein [Schleiferiaceae bacterium]
MIGYWIAMAFANTVAKLPFSALYKIADGLTFVLQHIIRYRKKVIYNNLKNAFPEKSPSEIQKIASGCYKNFADLLVETIKSTKLTREEALERVVLQDTSFFDDLHKRKKNCIVVLGHYANFEWVALTFPLNVRQACFAVFQPLSNDNFNRKVVQIRERFGLTLFPMQETYNYMTNNLTPNSLYGFIGDQSPRKDRIKYWTKFLNQYTPVHLGVENISRKYDMAVVFMEVHRVKRGFYELTPHIITDDAASMAPFEITEKHVGVLENIIQKNPADWLWSHKRWKHQPDATTKREIDNRPLNPRTP